METAADVVAAAGRVVALTGAGVSAESGIATFRDAGGAWAQVDVADVATPAGYRADPAALWRWYADRRRAMRAAAPNPAHQALAAIEARVADFVLVTQNIDGLHQRAGSRRVLELHGSVEEARCTGRGHATPWPDPEPGAPVPPLCPRCGARLRPDVVWFGEALPRATVEAAWAAAADCDVLLVVGTSAVVEPAASLPRVAAAHGAAVVEVNPNHTPLSAVADHVLGAPAGVVLPALVEAAWGAGGPASPGEARGRI
ncbi:MAG: NAD-dependent deacetylase [Anaerolineae bacterium]